MWYHIFKFKTLSFYCAFVRTFQTLFSFFALYANFEVCQLCLWHRAFCLPFRPVLFFANLSFCEFCLLGTSLSYLALHNSSFRFTLKNKINLNMLTSNEACLQNFEDFFLLKYSFSPQLEWKFIVIELPSVFLSFGSLYSGIFSFKSEQLKLAR